MEVARHAHLAQGLEIVGGASIGGDLHYEGQISGAIEVEGELFEEPVSIAPPCLCEGLLDVAEIITQAQTQNDNGDLDPEMLRGVLGAQELSLPCGRYYFDEISGLGEIRIQSEERIALMVRGDLRMLGDLILDLGPEAELDLFLGGNLEMNGGLSFLRPIRPSALRIYIGGEGQMSLGGERFMGNIYAPEGDLEVQTEIYGALLGRNLSFSGSSKVFFDLSVREVAQDCPEAEIISGEEPHEGVACERCEICEGNQACMDGICGPCETGRDCCGPSDCTDGVCHWVLF